MILCEAAAYYKKQGLTLWDQMVKMYEKYGFYKESIVSITLEGKEGANKIVETMKKCAKNTDIIVFGEAFLQGFYALNFDTNHDEKIAVSLDDPIIQEICSAAKEYATAVSAGR